MIMKTAEEITHELLISGDTVGYQRSHVIQAMEQYAKQQLDAYKSDLETKAKAYDQLEQQVNDLWDELEAEGNDYGLEQFGELVLIEFGLN